MGGCCQIGLNNLELSCDNILRLHGEVDLLVSKFFQSSPVDLQKVKAILDELFQTEKRFRHILQVILSQTMPKRFFELLFD